MFGIKFDAAESAANNLRLAIGDLRQQREQLNSQLEALEAQRYALYHQPVSGEDAKQFLFDYIDAWAAQWLQHGELGKLFQIVAQPRRDEAFAEHHNLTTPYLCLRDIESVLQDGVLKGKQVFGVQPLPLFGGALESMSGSYIGGACFFFGDVLKAKLNEYFDKQYQEPRPGVAGAPVSERRVLIQELDGQISELLAAIRQLDSKLVELGFREIVPMKLKEVDDPKHGKRLVRV